MWRFLRNRRLILRLHYYLGTHILGASRGGPCDSTALVIDSEIMSIFGSVWNEIGVLFSEHNADLRLVNSNAVISSLFAMWITVNRLSLYNSATSPIKM